jgi:Xaa-Pro dipeptidase
LSSPEHAVDRGPAEAFRARRDRVASWLRERDIDAAVLADFEGLRNASLRYLTGHPMDALLLLSCTAEALLVARDLPLAQRRAQVEELLPYGRFDRSVYGTLKELMSERGIRRAELSGAFPFPLVQELSQALPRTELLCRREGIDEELARLRAVKDAGELQALRQACRLTDGLVDEIEALLAERGEASETELALHLEARARERGAEGMSFETLAAGPERSYAIHAFPPYTAGRFGAPGLSILDFGVCWAGYRSDVTLTVLRGPLGRRQREMSEAVAEAYELALSLVKPGADPEQIGARVDRLLAERGYPMPHGLGHGIGLEAHEAPMLRPPRSTSPASGRLSSLRPGMVLTIEPGAYHPEAGGVRLENDLLVTEQGAEPLTRARILRMGG